eukprot:TRINITY_DN7_c14_g1_i1.p1 TRINITY_DN7_c14_g1~~TRINITY_DN7_c14_g1_i1.p1  ORF type:complete len:302 (-),score=62.35 TRINITY_DN7_c14_g1_i1:28-933(-)
MEYLMIPLGVVCVGLSVGTLLYLRAGPGDLSPSSSPRSKFLVEVEESDLECVSSPRHHRRGSSKKFNMYTRRSSSGGSTKSPFTIKLSEVNSKVKAKIATPLSKLPVFIDLPRLATRTSVCGIALSSKKQLASRELLVRACEMVEGKERSALLSTFLESKEATAAEDRLWMEAAFEEVIGTDSPTARVLKCVNQSVIMPAATEIKLYMYHMTGKPSKDSREKDGWRVTIAKRGEGYQVTHSREEVAFDESFKFSWKLKIELGEKGLVRGVNLKTEEAVFLKEMEVGKKQALCRKLSRMCKG